MKINIKDLALVFHIATARADYARKHEKFAELHAWETVNKILLCLVKGDSAELSKLDYLLTNEEI